MDAYYCYYYDDNCGVNYGDDDDDDDDGGDDAVSEIWDPIYSNSNSSIELVIILASILMLQNRKEGQWQIWRVWTGVYRLGCHMLN